MLLFKYSPPEFIKLGTLSAIGAAYVQGALGRLHQGELEAILLAREIAADYVVFDDPVSSLNSNILFIVSSLIKRLIDMIDVSMRSVYQKTLESI
jgi:ABC-type cobalamin/Fe3+-siderophores transport system ATPase subunit